MPLFANSQSKRSSAALPEMALSVVLLSVAVAGCGDPSPTPPAPGEAASQQQGAAESPDAQPQATPAAAATGRLQDRSFDDVKFEMEKGDPFSRDLLPPPVASLDGTRIRIRGYILPSFQQEGITQFVLVRDNMECCFGPGAALYDCIVVRMLPGRSTNFSVRPVAVSGTFHVEELIGPDGKHLAIYSLDGEEVE